MVVHGGDGNDDDDGKWLCLSRSVCEPDYLKVADKFLRHCD